MKHFKFVVPIYEVDVYLVQVEKGDSYTDIPEEVWDNLGDDVQDGIEGWFDSDKKDSGYTVHDPINSKIYVVFSLPSGLKKKVNTYYHECYHVTYDIITQHNIEDVEAAAYLQGFLGEYFHDFMFK